MVTMGTMGMEFPQLQQIHSSFSHTWWISSDVRTPSVFTSANCLSESYKNEILPRNREQINFMKNWHSGHQFQHLSYTQYNKFVLNFLNLVSVGIRKTIIQYSKYLWFNMDWSHVKIHSSKHRFCDANHEGLKISGPHYRAIHQVFPQELIYIITDETTHTLFSCSPQTLPWAMCFVAKECLNFTYV